MKKDEQNSILDPNQQIEAQRLANVILVEGDAKPLNVSTLFQNQAIISVSGVFQIPRQECPHEHAQ
jgi:hypothetical protein